MLRAVILFVGILSVVRATPFGLDSGDRPTPFRYSFRVEKVEFGNDAISGEPDGYYEIGPDGGSYVNEPYQSFQSELQAKLGKLDFCREDLLEEGADESDIPEEGCVYVADGNVHFFGVLSGEDVDDVYEAFKEYGLEECEVEVPEGGCIIIDERTDSIHMIGVYDDELTYVIDEMTDELEAQIGDIELCDVTQSEPPEGGCVLLADNKVGLINVLNTDNFDIIQEMAGLDLIECVFHDGHRLTTTEECYWIDKPTNSIIFENVNIKGSDDEDDYDYPFDYSQEINEIPDAEVTTAPSVQPPSLSGVLQRLKLKDVPERRSSAATKAKAALVKKVLTRQQAQDAQNYNRRRANHLPKWMKHLKKNV